MQTVFKMALLSAVLLMGVAHAQETPDENDIETNRQTPTDAATLVTLLPDKTMGATHIKVGHVADGHPLLCFKDPDKQLVSCFVVNTKTGQVAWVQLPADEKSI